mgnify:CR=1 FL=1
MSNNCTVCNNPVTDKYCGHCGQMITNKTARIWTLIIDFFSNFFSIDRSFIGTSRKILSDPKFIVENFHAGNRRFYLSPGSFILYGITLVAIHTIIFGPKLWGLTFDIEGIGMQYLFWLLLIPFTTFCSYLTFISQGFHLSKHIISNSYISTVFLFISLIIDDFIIIVAESLESDVFMFLFFIFTFLWNSFVFSTKKKVGCHILNTIIQILIFSGLFALLVILFQTSPATQ